MNPASILRNLSLGVMIAAASFHLETASVLYLYDMRSGRQALNIDTILSQDGHTLTIFSADDFQNFSQISSAINGDLSSYDVLVLDIGDDANLGDTEAASLEAFVNNGGRIFVTGVDSAIGYDVWGLALHPVLGNTAGEGSDRTETSPTVMTLEANSLTTGVVDIRGYEFPEEYDNRNYNSLDDLSPETSSVLDNSAGGAMWSLRTLSSGGEMAYVSTYYGFDYEESHAYSSALRNFVTAAGTSAIPEPSVVTLLLNGSALALSRRRRRAQLA